MINDKTTLKDLSFFTNGVSDIFGLINHTTTIHGKEVLKKHILNPPKNLEELLQLQKVVRFFASNPNAWTTIISNGTLVILEKYFETADNVATPSSFNLFFDSFFRKIISRNQQSLVNFSLTQLADFFNGCKELIELLSNNEIPLKLREVLQKISEEISKQNLVEPILSVHNKSPFQQLVRLNFDARRTLKNPISKLVELYALLDAWHAMGLATISNDWNFPEITPSLPVKLQAKGLFHPLINHPKDYDIDFNGLHNFLLLTGANMSGKTTFMRAIGVSSLLAHLGMGVPAKSMTISFLDGVVTNMHVEDNLQLGESYFFAEVKRMHQTAQQLQQPLPHLVLMDELFKGTNVLDAYECTRAVIEGLLHFPNHILILSTHLYEVAQQFASNEKLKFQYFETNITEEGAYSFTYELKDGITNDRIGYKILQQEGVLDLLSKNASK